VQQAAPGEQPRSHPVGLQGLASPAGVAQRPQKTPRSYPRGWPRPGPAQGHPDASDAEWWVYPVLPEGSAKGVIVQRTSQHFRAPSRNRPLGHRPSGASCLAAVVSEAAHLPLSSRCWADESPRKNRVAAGRAPAILAQRCTWGSAEARRTGGEANRGRAWQLQAYLCCLKSTTASSPVKEPNCRRCLSS
jgi:hypothetical protein